MILSANDWRAVCNELAINSGDFCTGGLCFESYEAWQAFGLIKDQLAQSAPLAARVEVAFPRLNAPFAYGWITQTVERAIERAKVTLL